MLHASNQSRKHNLNCLSILVRYGLKKKKVHLVYCQKSLNNGNGFFQLTNKEVVGKDRRIILKDLKHGGKLIEDFTHKEMSRKSGIKLSFEGHGNT